MNGGIIYSYKQFDVFFTIINYIFYIIKSINHPVDVSDLI